MSVVSFDYKAWLARYPEFSGVAMNVATGYFEEATLYLSNTDNSVVQDPVRRLLLFNMLVAHIAKLYSGSNGDPASPLVGRISSASEGSVSVSVEMPPASAGAAWYMQSQYGAAFWLATARYRRGRYVAGPRPRLNGLGPLYGRSGGW